MFVRVKVPNAGEGVIIGADVRLDWKMLKRRYYKLSDALHAPTIARMKAGTKPDMDRLREDCRGALSVVDEVLASSATVIDRGQHGMLQVDCGCGAVIRRRTDPPFVHCAEPAKGAPMIKVKCHTCVQSFEVRLSEAGDHFEVLPDLLGFECPHEACRQSNTIWERELTDGYEMDCAHCGGRILMSAALRPVVAATPEGQRA